MYKIVQRKIFFYYTANKFGYHNKCNFIGHFCKLYFFFSSFFPTVFLNAFFFGVDDETIFAKDKEKRFFKRMCVTKK